MPAAGRRGGGKFANVKTGARVDLPFRPRSRWEANIARLMEYKGREFGVEWFYERDTFYFPGERTTNRKVTWDFTLRPRLFPLASWAAKHEHTLIVSEHHLDKLTFLQPLYPTWLEVKGMLARGGRLDRVDLTSLKGRDDDSRVKLERFLHYYPHLAPRVWLLGEREYKWLERRYGQVVPHWEGLRRRVEEAQPSSESPSRSAEGLRVPKARKRATK